MKFVLKIYPLSPEKKTVFCICGYSAKVNRTQYIQESLQLNFFRNELALTGCILCFLMIYVTKSPKSSSTNALALNYNPGSGEDVAGCCSAPSLNRAVEHSSSHSVGLLTWLKQSRGINLMEDAHAWQRSQTRAPRAELPQRSQSSAPEREWSSM